MKRHYALLKELPPGEPPEWIQLLPPGPVIQGRDGRTFLAPDMERLVTAYKEEARFMPLDWEHASELRAPQGLDAPAAGWIVEMAVREEGLWGRVEWTERGAQAVRAREYRYISPVLAHISGAILSIVSAGLTNNPNLYLTALNRITTKEEAPLLDDILKALGLPPGTTPEITLNTINTLKTAAPSLDRFVPRADYDLALNRATNSEKELHTLKETIQKGEIETEVQAALAAGKITPATVDYHRAQCRTEGGIERFREYVKLAPVIAGPSGVDGKAPNTSEPVTGIAVDICRRLDITQDAWKKAGKEADHAGAQ